jgi:hypothetical protein
VRSVEKPQIKDTEPKCVRCKKTARTLFGPVSFVERYSRGLPRFEWSIVLLSAEEKGHKCLRMRGYVSTDDSDSGIVRELTVMQTMQLRRNVKLKGG